MKNIFKTLLLCACLSFFAAPVQAAEIKQINAQELLSELGENKGKIILINFFATWCPPCIEEIPDIVKIREEYGEDKLLILGLSVDNNTAPLPEFIQNMKINYPIYHSTNSLAAAYQVSSIPQNIIYDANLKPVYNESGVVSYQLLKEIIEDLL